MVQHNEEKVGFACRACGAATEVKDSRPVGMGETIRRRRHCTVCEQRATTYEVVGLKSSEIDAHLKGLDTIRKQLLSALVTVDETIASVHALTGYDALIYQPAAVVHEARRIDE